MAKFKKLRKLHPALIGLLQALAVAVYCFLVAGFVVLTQKLDFQPPQFLGIVLTLVLLVLSAAICGFLVFGMPLYLAYVRKWYLSKALKVLGFTFLFLLLVLFLVFLVIFIVL